MSDRIFGLSTMTVALAYIAVAARIPQSFLTDPLGPKAFPILIGVVAVACAIAVALKPGSSADWPGLAGLSRLAATFAILIAYAYLLTPGGFLIPTAVAAGLLSYQIIGRPLVAASTGVLLSAVLCLIFKYALGLGLAALPAL